MLTIATISPKQAEEYYQQENYYSKEAAQKNSEWWGRGAVTLGLNGSITDNEVYRNVINGLSPDGKQELRGKPKIKGFILEETQTPSKVKPSKKQKKQPKERAGIDLTFSAPKSVSVACLVGGDKQLEEAHLRAVKRTLEFIEKYYPQTRIKGQRVQTDNLIVAMWHHYLSRELDPHLHTHCILMNATQLVNGTWQSRTDENLYYNKILLGRIYRQELALECQKLGYEIESHPQELFEIKGYSREQIDAFSKRHEQIVKYLQQREIDITTESKVWAWRRTRIKKNSEIDRNEMLRYWHEEANLYGVVHPVPVPKVVNKEAIAAQLQSATAASIEHCSERKVAFKKEEIIKFVMAEIKPFGIDELERAIEQHPELIKTYDGRVTTQTALSRELGTIKLMHQGKGQVSPIAHSEVVESYLEGKKLTSGQREAIALAATTNNQFITWQGVAGAGKTYALNELKQITEVFKNVAQGYNIKGFAPSAEAARVLGSELGIEVNTVASLLASKQSENIQLNQIWIVDEAGMLNAKDGYALLQRASDEKARVILVGDTRQMSAVEAGNPFKSLQQAGIQTAYLNESIRQKSPDLDEAVRLAAAGQIKSAIAHLDLVGRIEEVPNFFVRIVSIAQEYIKLSPEERLKTLILVGTHKERLAIIQQIRAALKQEGTLGYGVKTTQLRAKDLTSVQSRYIHHYSIGDVVVPVRDYRSLKLYKSQPYTVADISKDKLILSDLAGNQLMVQPMKFRKTVYKREDTEIALGDRLKWTKNDREKNRRNGQEFVVTEIEEQTATIEYSNGKTDRFNLYQPLHADSALVLTNYSAQGKTADRVLISSAADRTVSSESFYVAISRAKYDLRIFAESREFLLEQAQQNNAQETVLELLQPQLVKSRSQSLSLTTNFNKLQEQNNGYSQQSRTERATNNQESSNDRHRSPERKNYSAREQSNQTERNNQAVRGQSYQAERTDRSARNYSNRELERVESQSLELLEAISRYLKQQAVEQLTAHFRRLSKSYRKKYNAERRTRGITPTSDQKHRGNARSPKAIQSVDEWQYYEQRQPTVELLEAIANHLEITAIESAPIAEKLQILAENLKHRQQQQINEVLKELDKVVCNQPKQPEEFQLALDAIANHIEKAAVESQLTPALGNLTRKLTRHQPLSSNLVEELNSTISTSLHQLETLAVQKQQEINKQAISAVLKHIEQSVVKQAEISSTVQSITARLSQFERSQTTTTMKKLEVAIKSLQSQLQAQALNKTALDAIKAIASYQEYIAIDTPKIAQVFENLLQNLTLVNKSQFYYQLQQLQTGIEQYQEHLETQMSQTTLNSSVSKNIPGLDYSKVDSNWVKTDKLKEQSDRLFSATPESTHNQHQAWQSRVNNQITKEPVKALADVFREIPLEEVAERLELKRDRHDKHKWRGEELIISINNQKFYDHLSQTGGYGAIDLVMQVKECSFRTALNWLSNSKSYLPQPSQHSVQATSRLIERPPFQPPIPDLSKWVAVRKYLLKKRKLPEPLVDELHRQGMVYADTKQNAVFVRKSIDGVPTGASLRGTYKNSSFKGLAIGSRREGGWFSFTQGSGQLERIVLTESAIDAISAAALAKKPETTMFLAIDGAGAVPTEILLHYSLAGVQVMVGYDTDLVGEEMARQVIEALPSAVRVKPSYGKDWNEQLLHQVSTLEALEQLSDLDFLRFYQKVVEYFQCCPECPLFDDIKLAQDDIDRLSSQINKLRAQQANCVLKVESMQSSSLYTWNKELDEAIEQLENTTNLVEQCLAEKKKKESQLKEWSKQVEAYQIWKRAPHTIEMRAIAIIFKLSQIQERLIYIQQQTQQHQHERRRSLLL